MADENNNVQEPDFLSMSDEELLNFNTSTFSAPAQEAEVKTQPEVEEQPLTAEEQAAATAALEADDETQGAGNEDDAKNDVDGGAADASGSPDQAASPDGGKAEPAKTDADAKKEVAGDGAAKPDGEAGKGESAAIDYKAEYERLTGTIKANGRDIKIKGTDDAIQLMQMGANYNKKMAALKPTMKLVKMLEANELLDESKLNFLIDLSKKDPAAINRLVTESGLDPLDLSAEKSAAYQPGNHAVDEREIALDEVVADLKDSEHFTRTLGVVSSKWDQASKAAVASNPQILGVINQHIATGIYDLIETEIESERTFGRLKGLSDIEAYRQVGDAIEARGGFNHLGLGSSQSKKETPTAGTVVAPKPKQADEAKLKDQRKAAGTTKAAAPVKGIPADFNPLGMSDEDFAKFNPR